MKRACFLIAAGALAGCVEQDLDVSAEAGAQMFQEGCAACHGVDARGGGDFGQEDFAILPDLTTLSARHNGVFPRDYVMGFIDGYHAQGTDPGPRVMPEFGASDMGPTVIVEENGIGTPVPARLLALSSWLETIQR